MKTTPPALVFALLLIHSGCSDSTSIDETIDVRLTFNIALAGLPLPDSPGSLRSTPDATALVIRVGQDEFTQNFDGVPQEASIDVRVPLSGALDAQVEASAFAAGRLLYVGEKPIVIREGISNSFELVLSVAAQGVVQFPDSALEGAIRRRLGVLDGPIRNIDMVGMTELDARGLEITDLNGLEYATELEELYLADNGVATIGELASMNQLQLLDLTNNPISDLSAIRDVRTLRGLRFSNTEVSSLEPLAGLDSLTLLGASGSRITDLSPLASLDNIRYLFIESLGLASLGPLAGLASLEVLLAGDNQIADLTPLATVDQLQELWLYGNQITDLESLAELPHLQVLWLFDNSIQEIDALVANGGVGEGDQVILAVNPLSAQACQAAEALRSRGADVDTGNSC